jgi:pimeloyl-ACP methyl ester carboxylesterase
MAAPTGGVVLRGQPNRAVFVFLHGLGSSEADIYPLACTFNERGYTCELVPLPINANSVGDLRESHLSSILETLHHTVNKYSSKIFLVGFSTGAALALLFAANHKVDGVFALSPFFTPYRKRLATIAITAARLFPSFSIRRRAHVTNKQIRKELILSRTLPFSAIRFAVTVGNLAFKQVSQIDCPILFFHSLDDKVAHYESTSEAVRFCKSECRLVSLNCLDHFLQFDITTSKVCDFVTHFFKLPSPNILGYPSPSPSDFLKVSSDLLKLYSDDRRQWTLILFQILAGALAAFAVLLYKTVDEIDGDSGPYYLSVYGVAASIYLIIATLYFNYANRVDVYIKMHIEPFIPTMSWATFRTSRFAAGRRIGSLTARATRPLYVVPWALGLISLLICFFKLKPKILDDPWKTASKICEYILSKGCGSNPLIPSPSLADLQPLAFFAAVLLWIFATWYFLEYAFYARRYLYRVPAAEQTNFETEDLLHRLFRSINPGCVRQPPSFWLHFENRYSRKLRLYRVSARDESSFGFLARLRIRTLGVPPHKIRIVNANENQVAILATDQVRQIIRVHNPMLEMVEITNVNLLIGWNKGKVIITNKVSSDVLMSIRHLANISPDATSQTVSFSIAFDIARLIGVGFDELHINYPINGDYFVCVGDALFPADAADTVVLYTLSARERVIIDRDNP